MTISESVQAIVKGLPPSFLGLCVLNTLFLICFGWFVLRVAEVRSAQEAQRMQVLDKLLTGCLPPRQETKP